jgi:hypothetical protein
MASASDLEQAAKQAWLNLAPLSISGTLRAKLLAFCAAISPQFNVGNPGDRPTINWNAILWAHAQTMSPVADNWPALRVAADYLYRLCFMTNQADNQSMITTAQAAAVLTAYNAQF